MYYLHPFIFKQDYTNLFIVWIICIIKSQWSTDILEDRLTASLRPSANIAFIHIALVCTAALTAPISNHAAT